MRLKQLWDYVPLPSKLKLAYDRLTLSKLTTSYFIFALVYCALQIAFHARGAAIESHEKPFFRGIMTAANVTERFAVLDSREAVKLCHSLDTNGDICYALFTPQKHFQKQRFGNDRSDDHSGRKKVHRRDAVFTPVFASPWEKRDKTTFTPISDRSGQIVGVNVTGYSDLHGSVFLNQQCVQALAWPDQVIAQSEREALAMVAYEVWLFGISVVAILNESIPHVIAAFATELLSAAWSSFSLAQTIRFEQSTFSATVDACDGVDVLPSYWQLKFGNELAVLVFSVVGLCIGGALSYKLWKQYSVQSFKRVGASKKLHRVYLLVLVLSVGLQLTAFFMVTALGLWIAELCFSEIGKLAVHRSVYQAVFAIAIALTAPWLYIGWTGVRRERRKLMLVFFFISSLLLAASIFLFVSPIYRLTFLTWNFFAVMTVTAFTLLLLTSAAAVACRTRFNLGLAHYLAVQDSLAEVGFTPVYFDETEKASRATRAGYGADAGTRRIVLERGGERGSLITVTAPEPAATRAGRVRFAPLVHPQRASDDYPADLKVPISDDTSSLEGLHTLPPGLAAPEASPFSPVTDGEITPNHKRTSSSATWWKHNDGIDFIQRGVNKLRVGTGEVDGALGRNRGVGLPQNVRPVHHVGDGRI